MPTGHTVRRGLPGRTNLGLWFTTVLFSLSLSICTCSFLSSVDSPDRSQVFVRRKRAKASDSSVDPCQQPSVGQGEGSLGGGRPRRLASTREAIVEDNTSYEESDSEGAYQPPARDASQESGFMEEDEEDEESLSPVEHPILGGRNVAHIPVNDWTQP